MLSISSFIPDGPSHSRFRFHSAGQLEIHQWTVTVNRMGSVIYGPIIQLTPKSSPPVRTFRFRTAQMQTISRSLRSAA